MTLWTWVKGEFGAKVAKTFNLKNSDGSAYDLTGLTITIKYRGTGSVVSRTSPDVVVVGAPTGGVIKWTPIAADTTTAGAFHFDIELTDANNNEVLPKYGDDFVVGTKVE